MKGICCSKQKLSGNQILECWTIFSSRTSFEWHILSLYYILRGFHFLRLMLNFHFILLLYIYIYIYIYIHIYIYIYIYLGVVVYYSLMYVWLVRKYCKKIDCSIKFSWFPSCQCQLCLA